MNAPLKIRELVLAEIYNKINRPEGEIILERVHYYDGWNQGNIQRGLVTIYSKQYDDHILLYKTYIQTYHIRVYTNKIHVYHKNNINQEPDLVIKLKKSTTNDQ